MTTTGSALVAARGGVGGCAGLAAHTTRLVFPRPFIESLGEYHPTPDNERIVISHQVAGVHMQVFAAVVGLDEPEALTAPARDLAGELHTGRMCPPLAPCVI